MKYDVDSYHDNCFMISGSGVHVALAQHCIILGHCPQKYGAYHARGGLTSYICNESLVYIAQKIG